MAFHLMGAHRNTILLKKLSATNVKEGNIKIHGRVQMQEE